MSMKFVDDFLENLTIFTVIFFYALPSFTFIVFNLYLRFICVFVLTMSNYFINFSNSLNIVILIFCFLLLIFNNPRFYKHFSEIFISFIQVILTFIQFIDDFYKFMYEAHSFIFILFFFNRFEA
jgi:hypothetical protein